MLQNVGHLDCYTQHLARMAEQTNVVIESDICNAQGAVIVPAGRHFDASMAERLDAHKLLKPIDQCIAISHSLWSQELLQLFQVFIERHEEVAVFHHQCNLDSVLVEACDYYETFPLLVQKLTVLKSAFPSQFKKSLFCAYMSMAIANRMGASRVDSINVFIAGLVHDVGILHLPPELILDKGEYKPEQWKAMQQHTVIGHDLLKQVDELPTGISRAVLEHHERFDGSGYPYSKRGSELGMTGQIIGMADTCLALYKRELAPKKLGFDALLPILQLNPDIYCRRVFSATVELIRDVPWPQKRVYSDDEMPEVISRLMVENEGIQHDYCVLYGLVTSIKPHLPADKRAYMLTRMAERIHQCLLSSGIMQSEHNEWMVISCGAQQTQDFLAIERLEVMYGEIKWQIRQLKRLLYLLWKNQQFKHQALHKQVQQGLWQIANYHKQHQLASLH